MHPPLDRPHPDCQAEIQALRQCHDTKPMLKFWACNEVKVKLDKCFKEEKMRMLEEMNKDYDKQRREEDELMAQSAGKDLNFQQYLATDKTYQKELEKLRQRKEKSSWFG